MNESWISVVAKFPRQIPASTSLGKCFPPSTRAHAVVPTALQFATSNAVFTHGRISMLSRLRLDNRALLAAVELCAEGKLVWLLRSGRQRLTSFFANDVKALVA